MLRDLIIHIFGIFEKVNWPPEPFEFPTLVLINLWNTQNPAYNEEGSVKNREKILAAGYDELQIINPFKNLLENDIHIFKCCNDIYALAVLIDSYFFRYFNKDRIRDIFTAFHELVYNRGQFSKMSFSHIYNFDCNLDTISINDFEILKIEDRIISRITGENPNFPSFLHPPKVGNYFLKFQDDVPIKAEEIYGWLSNNHKRASEIVAILQYIKDGVTHVDYTGLYFTPDWVNVIRRPGILICGLPRITIFPEGKNYFLDSEETQLFQKMLSIFYKYKSKIFENKCELRKIIGHAGRYYELSLSAERLDDRFIDLWISMEALFSPSDRVQLQHSIAENAAFFLNADGKEREVIFNNLTALYEKRSGLVHGGTGKTKDEIKFSDVEILSSYVRDALLRFTVLQLRGYTKNTDIFKAIRSAIFTHEQSEKLHHESSLKKFILEKEGIEINI
ncbi:MAG: HEPN domain-containing protein [Deltaproteobacteria bacterium]|nr:HEPN domain-containing protein [Deltaproteobacteria bacterium]